MAWSAPVNLGSNQSKTANQASLVLTTIAVAEANKFVVVVVAMDNNATAESETTEVASITDSAGGNTWTKAKEYTFSLGATQDGATVSVWYSKLTNQINSGGTITANFNNTTTKDATAISAHKFTMETADTVSVDASAVQGTSGEAEAITASGAANTEHLWVHGTAIEEANSGTYTQDTDYTSIAFNGTTGGAGATNMSVRGGWRIFTGTTDTVDVTTSSRESAQVLVAFKESSAVEAAGQPTMRRWQSVPHVRMAGV